MTEDGKLKYIDFPGGPHEQIGILDIRLGGNGDFYIEVSDGKKRVAFRYCISGGFESEYPETTKAISNLFDAFNKEVKKQ